MTQTSAELEIGPAAADDLAAIATIYAHHVLHGLGTFEEAPPDQAEMAGRMAAVAAAGLPWLVARDGGRVVGYACARPYNTRSGYRFSCEDSVFIAPDACGQGVGRRLLQAVIDRCTALGRTRMVAVIGDSGNDASIGLHRALGFEHAGALHAVGFKFGRWLDVVFMQRALAPTGVQRGTMADSIG